MKPFTIAVLVASFAIFYISCKKDVAGNYSGGTILEKTAENYENSNGSITNNYYYDQLGRDSVEVTTFVGDVVSPLVVSPLVYAGLFQYDAQGKLSKYTLLYNGAFAYAYNFDYDAQGRIIRKNVNPAGAYYNYAFIYDGAGNVIADSTFDGTTNALTAYDVYTYDENDNVAAQEPFAGSPLQVQNQFSVKYDDKINPFHGDDFRQAIIAAGHDIKLLSKNNILNEYVPSANPLNANAGVPYLFQYFSNGLPKSYSYPTVDSSGQTITVTKSFYYK